MMVLGARGAMGYVLGRGAGAAVAAQWWLSGGVSASNAIAVYQPIGAASLAASYSNLANPGTYDAAPGVAPTWAAAMGWTFNGSNQYLVAPLTVSFDRDWSFVVRYSDVTSLIGSLIGIRSGDSSARLQMNPGRSNNSDNRLYIYGNSSAVLAISKGGTATGIMAISGSTAYLNGVSDGSIPGSNGSASSLQFHIAARIYGASVDDFLPCKVQAIAIYNTTLSAAQVAAISSAAAAL